MIVIRSLAMVIAAVALLGGATACSALLGPDHQDGIDARLADLVDVMGANDAQPLNVPEQTWIDGRQVYNEDGLGTYYAMFGDECWTIVEFSGRVNESGGLEYGWAGLLPGYEENDSAGLQSIDNADDMAAFAAASCSNSTTTPDSP